MMKADPVRDETRTTHNYFAHGGNELVIGGKLALEAAYDKIKAAVDKTNLTIIGKELFGEDCTS